MYNISNPQSRKFRLFVLWKLLDNYISVHEYPMVVDNYINPQYRNLLDAIKGILPHTRRDQYTLYCRYNGDELFQIWDYLSMITAFRLMEAHDSRLLYLIRKDIGEWPEPKKNMMEEQGDLEIIFESCPDERIFSDIHRGRTEHRVHSDMDELSKSKKGMSRRQSSRRKSNRRSSKRQSTKRQSTKRQSTKRQSTKRQSTKRQSTARRASRKQSKK